MVSIATCQKNTTISNGHAHSADSRRRSWRRQAERMRSCRAQDGVATEHQGHTPCKGGVRG